MLFSSMTTATDSFHSRRILQQVQPSPQPVQFFLRSWVLVRLDLVDHSPHFPGNLDRYVALERTALQQLVLPLATSPLLGGHGPLLKGLSSHIHNKYNTSSTF